MYGDATAEQINNFVVSAEGLDPAALDAPDAEYTPDYGQGDAVEQAVEQAVEPKPQGPKIITLADLRSLNTEEAEPVVDGLSRRGETLAIVAATKIGKSHLVADLILNVATGGMFLGRHQCLQGKVLLIDNELFPTTIGNRLARVAAALRIGMGAVEDKISILPLRGKLQDIHGIGRLLKDYKPGDFDLVVLDAFYRALPDGADENDNGKMGRLLNYVDALAGRLNAAVCLICHTPKGDVSGREVTDLVAGAGAFTRAIDAIIGIRRHEQDGCYVVQYRVRNFAEPTDVVIEKKYPIFEVRGDLDPAKLYRPGKGSKSPADQLKADLEAAHKAWTPARFAAEVVGKDWQSKDTIIVAALAAGMKDREAGRMFNAALDANKIESCIVSGTGSPKRYRKS